MCCALCGRCRVRYVRVPALPGGARVAPGRPHASGAARKTGQCVARCASGASGLAGVGGPLGRRTGAPGAHGAAGAGASLARPAQRIAVGRRGAATAAGGPAVDRARWSGGGARRRAHLGLHPEAQAVLDGGGANTLLVVEHDPDLVRCADQLVAFGPGAGVHGGQVLHAGAGAVDPLGVSPAPKQRVRETIGVVTLRGARLRQICKMRHCRCTWARSMW